MHAKPQTLPVQAKVIVQLSKGKVVMMILINSLIQLPKLRSLESLYMPYCTMLALLLQVFCKSCVISDSSCRCLRYSVQQLTQALMAMLKYSLMFLVPQPVFKCCGKYLWSNKLVIALTLAFRHQRLSTEYQGRGTQLPCPHDEHVVLQKLFLTPFSLGVYLLVYRTDFHMMQRFSPGANFGKNNPSESPLGSLVWRLHPWMYLLSCSEAAFEMKPLPLTFA